MQPDLFQRIVAPLRAPLEQHLAVLLPSGASDALASLIDLGGLAGIAFALAAVASILARLRAGSSRPAQAFVIGVPFVAGLAAAGLLIWIWRHPSPGFESLFTRWDHLAFCALVGWAAAGAPPAWRKVTLAGLSVALLLQYYGGHAVALVAATGLTGFALVRTPLAGRPWALALAQAALIVAAYGWAFWVRSGNVLLAAPLQGLLAFAVLRHVSFVVEAARMRRSLTDYATFMAFYPGVAGVFGAPEVYAEFSRRNLVRPVAIDHARAARRVALGCAQAWVALRIPVSVDTVLASSGPLVAWPTIVVFFLRTALAVMGGWAMIEGAALFFGVQLRTNFRGLLTCQNPSELWWAWRGSLTNWLVQHVYGPLGGRNHLSRNILAAFGVSLLWHAIGVPFLTADFHPVQLVPVTLWASINATAVLVHAHVSRGGGTPPGPAGRAVRTVLMWVLGAMTPLLLSFQGGDAVARFPALLRALGLPV